MTLPTRTAAAFAAVTVTLLLAASCNINTGDQKTESPKEAPMELRVYDVPAGTAQQLRGTLMNALWRSDQTPPLGKATVSPDGKLVVTAPERIHKGIEQLVAQLGKGNPEAPPTIELKYWLVLGAPSPTPAPISPELQQIAPALEAVSKAQGGLSFDLLESLSVRSLADEEARVRGRAADIRQNASVSAGALVARISIESGIDLKRMTSRLETRVELKPDQLLVLGETGVEVQPGDLPGTKNAGSSQSRKLFYVVKPTIIAAAAKAP